MKQIAANSTDTVVRTEAIGVGIQDAYLSHCRLAGLRPRTVDARATVLRLFDEFLIGYGATILGAGRAHCAAFIGRDHLAPASRRAYRSHLKAFYAWALEEGVLASDPTDRLPAVRVPITVPRPISKDELRRALEHAMPVMRAWLLLMASCGLRCCEVAPLRPRDVVCGDDGTVLLYLRETKGGQPAWQPAHPLAVQALTILPLDCDGLWWSTTPHSLGCAVRKHLHACGVDGSAHRLRHFAGTAWYAASGADLLTTARLLRHVNVATTQGYAALDPRRSLEVVSSVALPG